MTEVSFRRLPALSVLTRVLALRLKNKIVVVVVVVVVVVSNSGCCKASSRKLVGGSISAIYAEQVYFMIIPFPS